MSTINLSEGPDIFVDSNTTGDTINGLGGNDQITGGDGDDIIDGGSGNDILTGGLGHDALTGGLGIDTFRDTMAGLNGDHITDLLIGDRIEITDLTTANFGLNGNSITFGNGDSVIVDNLGPGRLAVHALTSGGYQLILEEPARNDFNGDGISDLMWRDSTGTMSEWLGSQGGGFQWNPSSGFAVGTDWSMLGFGDFNGDGRNDILWRQSGSGTVMEWLGGANGSSTFAWNLNYDLSTTFSFQTLADFNGDGHEDIMWRASDGTLSEWLGQGNGSFAWNPNAAMQVTSDWNVIGSGDFNGDGHDDLLWRQDGSGTVMEWLATDQGGFAWNVNYALPTDFHLVGTGDFNGDGLSDIMWRASDGTLSEWLGQNNGSFAWNPNAVYAVSTNSQVASIGDFNGDGIDDLMWQTSGGHLSQWLGQQNGSFAVNQGVQYDVSTSLQIQPPPDHFL
jgi:hypothetical protein